MWPENALDWVRGNPWTMPWGEKVLEMPVRPDGGRCRSAHRRPQCCCAPTAAGQKLRRTDGSVCCRKQDDRNEFNKKRSRRKL